MNKKGFTLIELLIVILIIGILLAIAVPKFSKLRACGDGKQYSDACLRFKAKNPDMFKETTMTPEPTPTYGVQVINDTTIGYKGHVYRKAD